MVRFRPIMMTTMAALAGIFPVAIGYGDGGETRVPLGMAVVGGLVVSQFLTLYLTPVIYIYMDMMVKWVARVSGHTARAEIKATAAVAAQVGAQVAAVAAAPATGSA